VRLWRISNYADLSGRGGLFSSGRWHSRGTEIVYLADHPAAALLETLVHLEIDPDDLPSTYQLLDVEIPDSVVVDAIRGSDLPAEWRRDNAATQPLGDRWLREQRTALSQVPSAITPFTANWLLNPKHPDAAAAKIVNVSSAPFDQRLFR
jgi:RES domain-containing protein